MNGNGKWMKPKAPIWPKSNNVKPLLSKPMQSWANQMRQTSGHLGGRMKFGTIERTYCNKIQPIETFAEYESATNFKGFEFLQNNVLIIKDQLHCSNVTKFEQMYDQLQQLFKMFQHNFNKLTFKLNCKIYKDLQQTTLHDMFKQ